MPAHVQAQQEQLNALPILAGKPPPPPPAPPAAAANRPVGGVQPPPPPLPPGALAGRPSMPMVLPGYEHLIPNAYTAPAETTDTYYSSAQPTDEYMGYSHSMNTNMDPQMMQSSMDHYMQGDYYQQHGSLEYGNSDAQASAGTFNRRSRFSDRTEATDFAYDTQQHYESMYSDQQQAYDQQQHSTTSTKWGT